MHHQSGTDIKLESGVCSSDLYNARELRVPAEDALMRFCMQLSQLAGGRRVDLLVHLSLNVRPLPGDAVALLSVFAMTLK